MKGQVRSTGSFSRPLRGWDHMRPVVLRLRHWRDDDVADDHAEVDEDVEETSASARRPGSQRPGRQAPSPKPEGRARHG